MSQTKKPQKKTQKKIALEETIIYKELQKRNFRLLLTGIFSLILGSFGVWVTYVLHSIFAMVVGGILLICAIYQFYLVYLRNENPLEHPDLKRFELWSGKDYEKIVKDMEEELQANGGALGSKIITDSFGFFPSTYRIKWFHLTQICWIHGVTTAHSVNFIPTGKTYSINIYVDTGESFIIHTNKSRREDDLTGLLNRVPFAIFGHNKEIQHNWEHNREQVIIAVKTRLNEYLKNPKKFIKENYDVVEEN